MEMKPNSQREAQAWLEVSVDDLKAASENALSTGPFGSSIGAQFFERAGVPVIRGSNLASDGHTHLIDNGFVFVSEAKAAELRRSTVFESDLIFTCWGTINQVGLIDDQATYPRYIISNKQMKFTPDPKKADSLFLFYLFSGPELQRQIGNQSIGSSVPGFNLGQLRALRFRVPPLPEQRAIAEVLSDVDALIAALDRLIAKKRAIKQGAMQQLLTGQARLPSFSEPWEVKTLGEIGGKFLNGGTPSTQKTEYWDGNIPWITGADVIGQRVSDIRRFITEDAVRNSSTNVVEQGNLLIVTRTGVGKLAIAPFDLAISQDLTGVYLKSDQALPEYVFRYLDYNSDKLASLNQGTSIAGITRETLMSMMVSLPLLPEQRAIAAVLSDMDAEIAALQARREKTRALKQGMMQELLTGKTRLV